MYLALICIHTVVVNTEFVLVKGNFSFVLNTIQCLAYTEYSVREPSD